MLLKKPNVTEDSRFPVCMFRMTYIHMQKRADNDERKYERKFTIPLLTSEKLYANALR